MFFIIFVLTAFAATNSHALFHKVQGIQNAHISRVSISRTNPEFIAVASRNALYTSKDHGAHFKKIASVTDEQITHIFIDESENTYLAGERHCYKINKTTEKIFSARDNETINFVTKHQGRIYIATNAGLYYETESLHNWQSVSRLNGTEIYSIEPSGDDIYLAGNDGAYRLRLDGTLQRLFSTRGNDTTLTPQLLKVDIHNPDRLWIGTNKGLFYSTDHGQTWQKFYTIGAANVAVNCFVQPPIPDNSFYLCTDAGLFKVNINDGTSRPLYEGISTSEAWWMDFGTNGEIYLATSQGLFTDKQLNHTTSAPAISIDQLVAEEPPIQEIQKAALHYNSIHPDKVNKWRRQLKYRALFPKVSVDYDCSLSTYGGEYYEGPRDWGLTLTWDLGDLIWHNYEDDIDNRSKLTTQLRVDILDEINRIYFERLRLKQELALIDNNAADSNLKKLRLQELTATLDGYTGGYISRARIK